MPRASGGRARTYPDAVVAHRACGSRTNREYMSSLGIRAVIAEKKDQIVIRKKHGILGDRPLAFEAAANRNHNVVECSLSSFSNGEA